MARLAKSYAVLVDASDVAPSRTEGGRVLYDYAQGHCFEFFGAKMYVRGLSLDKSRQADVTFICRGCGKHIERRINRGAFTPVLRCGECNKAHWATIDAERAEKAGQGGYKHGRTYFEPSDELLIQMCGFFACTLKPISQLRAKRLFCELDERFNRIEPGTLWPRLTRLCKAGKLSQVPTGLNASGGTVYSLVPNNPERLQQWNDALWAASKPVHRKRFKLKAPIELF
ncbi:hypothetical protein IWQ55_000284 [Labrenzia sp. EL_208]|nr:hypothetical protein [Labrenzia sp. EL_132]MBG6227092.1 hypothetical protein [Labrenzia sp. EL_208]